MIDLETTGLAREVDRIVEIAILKFHPDGRRTRYCKRVNPQIPIPPEASEVHGIRDEHVKGEPIFKKIARQVALILRGCDIAGFNVASFDLRVLEREFERAGIPFASERRMVIDCKRIFHAKEPRDLQAAARFYLGTEHGDAHSALADARVCWRVLEAQLCRYPDLPRDVAGLHDFCGWSADKYLDSGRKFEWRYGQASFAFGKHQGRLLKEVAKEEPDYLQWMAGSDFPADTKKIVKAALDGKFPKPNVASDRGGFHKDAAGFKKVTA
jgi:DNA polymerase-3 subunit epsilon